MGWVCWGVGEAHIVPCKSGQQPTADCSGQQPADPSPANFWMACANLYLVTTLHNKIVQMFWCYDMVIIDCNFNWKNACKAIIIVVLPSSTVESNWVTLTFNRPTLSCKLFVLSNITAASWTSSANISSACRLKLLSWRIMLQSELFVTHSSSLRVPSATFVKAMFTGETVLFINGIFEQLK